MELTDIKKIIDLAVAGEITSDHAMDQLKVLAGSDIGYAKIDYQRSLRNGFPEVIYCPGKRIEHIVGIVADMMKKSTGNIMASRATQEVYDAVRSVAPDAIYYEVPRIILIKRQAFGVSKRHILVVTAGTADIPVAEEAALTAEILGNRVERLFDVGVAGIHRLLDKVENLRKANVVIVVAGMEGALPSVVGGLVDKQLVERVALPGDRRRARVGLSAKGQALHAELFPQVAELNRQLLEALDDTLLAGLDLALQRLETQAGRINGSFATEVRADRHRGIGRRGAGAGS